MHKGKRLGSTSTTSTLSSLDSNSTMYSTNSLKTTDASFRSAVSSFKQNFHCQGANSKNFNITNTKNVGLVTANHNGNHVTKTILKASNVTSFKEAIITPAKISKKKIIYICMRKCDLNLGICLTNIFQNKQS